MSWERLQEDLFEQLFSTTEEYITLCALLKLMEPVSKIWSGLERILIEDASNDFDFWKSIDSVKILEGYIFLQVGSWEYIVIDPVDKNCLSDEECKILFDEEFFMFHFDEPKTENNFVDMYYFENAGEQTTIKQLIEYIGEYQDILDARSRVSVWVQIAKRTTIIGFMDFSSGEEYPTNVNYLHINEVPKLIGASNPTNNNESLLAMGARVADIRIPVSVIPRVILGKETQRLVKINLDG